MQAVSATARPVQAARPAQLSSVRALRTVRRQCACWWRVEAHHRLACKPLPAIHCHSQPQLMMPCRPWPLQVPVMTAPRRLAAPAARSNLLSQTVVAKAAAAAAPEAATEAVAYLRFIRGSPLKVRSS